LIFGSPDFAGDAFSRRIGQAIAGLSESKMESAMALALLSLLPSFFDDMLSGSQQLNSTTINSNQASPAAAGRESRPVVVVDQRERDPLIFHNLASVRGTLYTGDYSILGSEELIAIERKTIPDLVSCCMGESRDRFERELHRLRGFHFKRLLVIGSRGEIELQRYYSRITPKAVLATLSAFEVRYDCPVVFAPTAAEAASQVERLFYLLAREMTEIVKKMTSERTELVDAHTCDKLP
jgi:DNA excision repair protein ERCC-4